MLDPLEQGQGHPKQSQVNPVEGFGCNATDYEVTVHLPALVLVSLRDKVYLWYMTLPRKAEKGKKERKQASFEASARES